MERDCILHDPGDPAVGANLSRRERHHDQDTNEHERASKTLGVDTKGNDHGDANQNEEHL